MKKIMIALGTIACAVSLQAASVNWATEGIQTTGDFDSGEGAYAAGYLVYLFDNTGSLSQAQMTALIAAAATGGTDWKTALGSSMGSFVADENGAGYVNGLSAADGTFNGYMVILDAGTVDAAQYAFVSQVYSAADNSLHKIAFGDFDGDGYINALDYSTAGQAGSNWTAVPEPTSGLLMLLGMAGLALRRRRA